MWYLLPSASQLNSRVWRYEVKVQLVNFVNEDTARLSLTLHISSMPHAWQISPTLPSMPSQSSPTTPEALLRISPSQTPRTLAVKAQHNRGWSEHL